MLAIAPDRHTAAWAAYGQTIGQPAAIAVISAHWVTMGTHVSSSQDPETIHDFRGFPAELFAQRYPAKGSPDIAAHVHAQLIDALGADQVRLTHYGLDHGAWAVLKYLVPDASIPVFQISLDQTMSPAARFDLGRVLGRLRAEGVMILGSGNIVHNLQTIVWDDGAPPYAWALEFAESFKRAFNERDVASLVNYETRIRHAALAHPTPDHYWPVLVCLGALIDDEPVKIITDGIELGSISMLSWGT